MVFALSSAATFWLGMALVCGFMCWKFIIQPIANEGQPIDPPQTSNQSENKSTSFDIFEGLPDIVEPQNGSTQSF